MNGRNCIGGMAGILTAGDAPDVLAQGSEVRWLVHLLSGTKLDAN